MSIEEIIDKLEEMAADREETILPGCLWYDEIVPLREAIALLRTHPEAQPNEPLTLEELLEMDGEVVYLAEDHKWWIVSTKFEGPWENGIPCGVDKWGAGTSLSLLARCGVYRRPPKKEA